MCKLDTTQGHHNLLYFFITMTYNDLVNSPREFVICIYLLKTLRNFLGKKYIKLLNKFNFHIFLMYKFLYC